MPGIDSYTKLMLHMDGENNGTVFTDSSLSPKTVNVSGNGKTVTGTKKIGTASYLGDGTGDDVYCADSTDWNISSGDWTIDFWFYAARQWKSLCGRIKATAPYSGYYIGIGAGGYVYWYTDDNTVRITSSSTFTDNTWTHVAVVKSGTTTTMYLGGSNVGSYTGSPQEYSNNFVVGNNTAGGGGSLLGYIDEFRFSKGIARWTANFTPQTVEYTADAVGQFMSCNKGYW
jgi:hypothetical protein